MIDIEAEAVLRVIRNPEGLFSEQDGSYGYQLSRTAADNRLRYHRLPLLACGDAGWFLPLSSSVAVRVGR